MTVAELIDELKRLDPALPVVVSWDGRYCSTELDADAVEPADWADLWRPQGEGRIALIEAG